jgi:hypothetical protein
MVAGALTGGLGALAQAYGGYAAGQQRAKDLEAQAKSAGAALDTIKAAQAKAAPSSAAQELAKPMTEAAKAQQAALADPFAEVANTTSLTGNEATGGGLAPSASARGFEFDPYNEGPSNLMEGAGPEMGSVGANRMTSALRRRSRSMDITPTQGALYRSVRGST